MDIGIDVRCLMAEQLSGVGEYTKNLLQAISQVDQDNRYYLFFNSAKWRIEDMPTFDSKNVEYVRTDWPNRIFNLAISVKLIKPDKIIEKQTGCKLDLMFLPNLNFMSCDCPYVATCHDLSYEIFPEFFTFKSRWWHKALKPRGLFHGATKVVSVSVNTAHDLQNIYGLPAEQIEVIHSAAPRQEYNFSAEEVKEKYSLPEKYILFIGSLEPRKNLKGLLAAYAIFQKKYPDIKLVVAGATGWKNADVLKAMSDKKNIQYLKFVEASEKKALYQNALMLVYPGFYEGFGFPPLEAMEAGCPVITAPNSSLGEVCGEGALYANPYKVNELIEAMEIVLAENTREKMIDQGLKRSAEFTWNKTAEQYINLWQSII